MGLFSRILKKRKKTKSRNNAPTKKQKLEESKPGEPQVSPDHINQKEELDRISDTESDEELERISDTDSDSPSKLDCSISSDDGEDCEEAEEVSKTKVVSLSEFILPTKEELEKEARNPFFRDDLLKRINNIVKIIDSKNLKNDMVKHKDYLDQLVVDLSKYHGFTEFIVEEILKLFDVKETLELFKVDHKQLDTCICLNSLKAGREEVEHALLQQNINCMAIPWCSDGIVVFKGKNKLTTTEQYKDGQFTILNSSSSFLPIMTLAPRKHQKIADLLSNGERTTYIATLMKNTGTVYANVASESSISALSLDITRLGLTNTKISASNTFTFLENNLVDRVLLSAPSTGTGFIGKRIYQKISKQDLERMVQLQKKLLLQAIDMVNTKSKSGGYVVYTTMSLLVEENEAIINYAMKERDVRLVSTGFNYGRQGFTHYKGDDFHPDLKETKRFYPHVNNMDGIFVAKLKKNSDKRHM